jgi:predicted nucleic acid-binding protein
MYLVDTNIISGGASSREATSGAVADWMERNSDRLYLSVITVTEIGDGIAKARRTGAIRKADLLAEWFGLILHLYDNRILPFDLPAAHFAAQLSDYARAMGLSPGFPDLAIAATAQARSLTVLTRNLRHFTPLGVQVKNPYDLLPE